jgi:hypothetical protein
MSVNESVMLKLFSYTGWAGNRKASAISSTCLNDRQIVNPGIYEPGCKLSTLEIADQPMIAHREVYLENYKSHEEVVRAYLEFAGIDPDSREGQFYFKL